MYFTGTHTWYMYMVYPYLSFLCFVLICSSSHYIYVIVYNIAIFLLGYVQESHESLVFIDYGNVLGVIFLILHDVPYNDDLLLL